jgi:hypothetical protein
MEMNKLKAGDIFILESYKNKIKFSCNKFTEINMPLKEINIFIGKNKKGNFLVDTIKIIGKSKTNYDNLYISRTHFLNLDNNTEVIKLNKFRLE